MYPDFRYLLGALGIEAPQWVGLFKTFGLLVALSFIAAAWVLTQELKRKEALGWFGPDVQPVKPPAAFGLAQALPSALIGFLFGYKVGGLITYFATAGADPVTYIFSAKGNFITGLLGAAVAVASRVFEQRKAARLWQEKFPNGVPEGGVQEKLWPHQRVGEMVILAATTGFLGAKIFNALETWDDFVRAPLQSLISGSGFTFYGGLITATAFFVIYARRRRWNFGLLADCITPGLMLAYGLGRLGCQMSGDGDWGIANSAYVTDVATGDLRRTAGTIDFQNVAARNPAFTTSEYGADRVQHAYVPAPSWLPRGLFAMNYPHNVNEQGLPLAGCTDGEYCTVLPLGVFPTPIYEAIICISLFGMLWAYRRKLTRVPLRMSGAYFFLNGVERFFIEKIRVNTEYDWGWLHPSQAEIISVGMMIAGLALLLYTRGKRPLEIATSAPRQPTVVADATVAR